MNSSYDPPPSTPSSPGQMSDKDARTWAMLCHLSSLAGYVIPFGNIVGPLVVWLMKRNDHPFIDDQGKESLNFQISVTIYLIVALISILAIIGIILTPIVAICQVVFMVIACIKSSNGEYYRYPLTIRMVN